MERKGTLAARLGVTTHVSPLRMKLRRIPDANDVESVSLTPSPALLTAPHLFVRVEAGE